jgi:hypothetical protein
MKNAFMTIFCMTLLFTSCGGEQKNNSKKNDFQEDEFETNMKEMEKKEAEAEGIAKLLCQDFPQDLILSHNPDAQRIEIEPVEYIPGKLDHCKIKLFYGDRDYDFWAGQVGAYAQKTDNPFFQYSPERNPALYHKIDDIGEKALFIANTYQLLIVKDKIVYHLTPPNNGSTTSTGKENKEIVLEMAKHYGL